MLTDHPELFDGMRLVPCAVMTDNANPQAGWLFIPHVDGKWVSVAKLAPFSQQIINYWWNRPSSAEVRAEAQEPVAWVIVENGVCVATRSADFSHITDGQYRLCVRALDDCAPQPPAPCPKCEHYKRVAANRLIGLCKCGDERATLQAKVAEQGAEIERLTKERDEYNSAWQRSGVEYRKLRDSFLSLVGEFK